MLCDGEAAGNSFGFCRITIGFSCQGNSSVETTLRTTHASTYPKQTYAQCNTTYRYQLPNSMCPQFPDTNTDTTRRLRQYPAESNPMSRKQRQHDGTSELRRRYQLIATGQVAPSPLRRLQSTIPRTEISPTRIQLLTHLPSSRTPYATLLANFATAADTVIEALLPHENAVTTQSSKARSLSSM